MIKSEAKWFLGKEYQNSVFVLADDSQDRLTQLNRVGMNPRIMISKFQVEKLLEASLSPIVFVKTSAEEKARDVAAQLCKNKESYDIILGFHTVAVMDEKILKKPSTREEALSILKQLSGRYHSVITGVSLLHSTKRVKTFSVETEVKMGEIDEETLKEYVKDDEWIGKPVGYGIYYKGSTFIETNYGNFFNIMGIPVYETIEKIRKMMYGAKKPSTVEKEKDIISHQKELVKVNQTETTAAKKEEVPEKEKTIDDDTKRNDVQPAVDSVIVEDFKGAIAIVEGVPTVHASGNETEPSTYKMPSTSDNVGATDYQFSGTSSSRFTPRENDYGSRGTSSSRFTPRENDYRTRGTSSSRFTPRENDYGSRGTSSSRFTPRENNYNSQQRPRGRRGNEFNPGNREVIDLQARYDAGVAEQKQNTFFDPEFDIDAEEEAALAASKANLFNSALGNQTEAAINVPTQDTSNQPTIKGRFYDRPAPPKKLEGTPKVIRDEYSSTFIRATGTPGISDLRRVGVVPPTPSFQPTHSRTFSDQDDWG